MILKFENFTLSFFFINKTYKIVTRCHLINVNVIRHEMHIICYYIVCLSLFLSLLLLLLTSLVSMAGILLATLGT